MALFTIINEGIELGNDVFNFKTSNVNIHVDTLDLKISELQITEQEWLGN